MSTWAGPYNCTDCGKEMDQAGTCKDCIKAAERLVVAVKESAKDKKGGKK